MAWAPLAAMMLVLMSNNLGIMWVGMEATTLLSAFPDLALLTRIGSSLEAMWKYLIICLDRDRVLAFMGHLARCGGRSSRPAAIGADAAVLDASSLRARRAFSIRS